MSAKERPIIFNAAMVRALLDGSKTQTRRIIRHARDMEFDNNDPHYGPYWQAYKTGVPEPVQVRSPYGHIGNLLWVREAHAIVPATAYRCSTGVQQTDNPGDLDMCAVYREGWERSAPGRWRPSIHMPRWASRITLEITDIRVQRLQEISEEDARAEGITDGGCLNCGESEPCGCSEPLPDARDAFAVLWQVIHGSHSWHADPWVWAISFRRVLP